MSAAIATLNGTIWGSGFPDRLGNLTTELERQQAVTALSLQSTKGVIPYSDAAMFGQFRDAIWHRDNGITVTDGNWRDLARQESARLYALGFTQVHSPPIAQRIFENFRTGVAGASALDPAVFPSGINNAAKQAEDAIAKFRWQYIAAESVNELGEIVRDSGKAAKNTIESVGNVAENITNPIALSSLAIIALVGGGLFLFNKVT